MKKKNKEKKRERERMEDTKDINKKHEINIEDNNNRGK